VLPDFDRFVTGAPWCSAMQRDAQRVILRQRIRGSVRAVRAVQNTRVCQTETRVVADKGVKAGIRRSADSSTILFN
jgi:hypothetical protein